MGFWDLQYWPSLKVRHNLDVMHIEKNIFDNISGTLLELEGRNKDTLSGRLELEKLGIRNHLHIDKKNPVWKHAPYCLSKTKKNRVMSISS